MLKNVFYIAFVLLVCQNILQFRINDLHVHTLNCGAFLQKLNPLLFTYIKLRRIFAEMRRSLMYVNNKEKNEKRKRVKDKIGTITAKEKKRNKGNLE